MQLEAPPARWGWVRVKDEDGELEIYYELYEALCTGLTPSDPPPARVLMVMGLAAACVAWHTQIQALLVQARLLGRPLQVCAFDNRGVGRSSCPEDRRRYSTEAMARDAAAVMDQLGWEGAHVIGFSMGTMIAAKLASAVSPERIHSLVMIGATGGGFKSVPRSFHAIRHSLRAMSARTLVARARADLRLHFTKATLQLASVSSMTTAASANSNSNSNTAGCQTASSSSDGEAAAVQAPAPAARGAGGSPAAGAARTASAAAAEGAAPASGAGAAEVAASAVAGAARAGSPTAAAAAQARAGPGGLLRSYSSGALSGQSQQRRQKEDLVEEYVAHAQIIPPQEKHGLRGQLHALWHHRLRSADKAVLRARRFPVLFIHGYKDKVAPSSYAIQLSKEIGAQLALLPGAHVVMRESSRQVNALLFDYVFGEGPVAARGEVAPIPVHAARYHSGSGGAAVAEGAAVAAAAGAAVAAAASFGEEEGSSEGKGSAGRLEEMDVISIQASGGARLAAAAAL